MADFTKSKAGKGFDLKGVLMSGKVDKTVHPKSFTIFQVRLSNRTIDNFDWSYWQSKQKLWQNDMDNFFYKEKVIDYWKQAADYQWFNSNIFDKQ